MPIDLGALAGGFAEGAGEQLITYGIGAAIAEALRPEAVELGQEAWKINPSKAVDVGDAAAIVAEDVERLDWGAAEAALNGIDGDRFNAIVGEVLSAPGIGPLFEAWRRDLIDDATFTHGLRKAKLETIWDAPLMALKDRLLSIEELANARQQGFIDQARQVQESSLQGVDAERAEILFDIVGLPPGAAEAMQAVNRGLADEALFAQMIREGHTKVKYTDLLYAMRRRLLTPSQYEEAALRGVITNTEADAGAALSGMEETDAQLLFEIMGRPLAVHQITTGLERGGAYGGTYDDVPEPYRDAIRRSNIRPEYAGLAYANRFTIPSYFILRAILNDGGMTADDFAQYGKDLGWPPDLADKAAAALSGGGKATADPHVAKAQTQLWGTLHKSYVDEKTDKATAGQVLSSLGVAESAQPEVLALWDAETALVRKPLSAAQIKKALGEGTFTTADATARLVALGMSAADAAVYLAE